MDRAPANLQLTVIAASVLLLVGGLVWFGTGNDQPEPITAVADTGPTVQESIAVHISGEILDPGVVSIPTGSRIADAVAAAGGATARADLAAVNLAAEVSDGDRVTIPAQGDTPSISSVDGVDLNRADAAQMEDLPGVGPVLAARIVAFREDHGPFDAVEDLLDVPGIGEAKLEGMRDAITSP